MSSQFFGLNIAYSGLLASNAALNTTANNIANVETEGYSRQQVSTQAAKAIRTFEAYGCAGAGVETLAIERVRDQFYDDKFWANNKNLGEYNMKQYYMAQIETYFNDDGKSGFKSVFDNMMITGLGELLKNPASDTAKAQFIGYAESLTEYFNGMVGNMETVQKDINAELKLLVDEVNSIAGQIATLNKQINTIELTGTRANELRDQRDLLIDRLSEIVDVETSETPIVDANNEDRETGANRYIVKIAGGQILVDGNDFNGLECVARTAYEKVNQSDIDGLYDVYWSNGQKFNLYNAAMGGELRGLVHLRDGNNGEYFHGTVTEVDSSGPQTKVTIEVTEEYLIDLNKSNLTDQGGIINLGNKEYYFESWEYTRTPVTNASGEVVSYTYSYTFTMSGSEKNPNGVTNDRIGKEASVGAMVDYQGVPYYMAQMDEWVRTFSQQINDIFTAGYGANDLPGVILFTGDWATDKYQYAFTTRYDTEASKAVTVSVNSDSTAPNGDSYYQMTAKNFNILDALGKDSSLLANRFNVADGVDQYDLLNAVKDLYSNKEKVNFRGSSASEFLDVVLTDVTMNASAANVFYSSYQGISKSIDNQRLSVSGVDQDEEALALIKFQNAYNLASKMIQTFTEIYDRLILETGV